MSVNQRRVLQQCLNWGTLLEIILMEAMWDVIDPRAGIWKLLRRCRGLVPTVPCLRSSLGIRGNQVTISTILMSLPCHAPNIYKYPSRIVWIVDNIFCKVHTYVSVFFQNLDKSSNIGVISWSSSNIYTASTKRGSKCDQDAAFPIYLHFSVSRLPFPVS